MNDQERFFTQFRFDPAKSGFVGVEREQFVVNRKTGCIAPLVPQYIQQLEALNGFADNPSFAFGYELSACQLESKIGPCHWGELGSWLERCETMLSMVDSKLGVSRMNYEIAPEDMPLDIYPDPTGRYQDIVRNMPSAVLSAACRVAGTHIHIGMPDLSTAIRAYNQAIAFTERLIELGDGSSGQRMNLYRVMAKRYLPEPIRSVEEFYTQALQHGFVSDPRKCWTMIRISVHGTVEFRMFGATDSIDQIVGWTHECHTLCS